MSLRNLLSRTPSGRLVLGTPFIGRLGSEILAASSTGTHGPGPMANDGLDPLRRYRMLVVSSTFPGGALQINELGQLVATASGTFVYQLLESNFTVVAPAADRTGTVAIGAVVAPPAITSQPAPASATAGNTVVFTVVATGTAPLSYQWRRNGTAIAGATAANYSLSAALIDNGAVFSVLVTNAAGTATSANVTLTVAQPATAPTFTTQPQSLTVTEGQAALFSASAAGTAPIQYQWLRDGAPIAGAIGPTLTLPGMALIDNGSVFALRATNVAGTVQSAGATLTVTAVTVGPPPVIVRTVTFMSMARSIVMDLPDCPVFTIVEALREAATKLYEDGRAWRMQNALIATTAAGQAFYTVGGIPTGAVLVGLPVLWVGDRMVGEYRFVNVTPPNLVSNQWQAAVAGQNSIQLIPAPDRSGQIIRGEIALAPSRQAATLLEELWLMHRDGIRSYARALLMEQIGKPWSNPTAAQQHRRAWNTLLVRYSSQAGPVSSSPRLRVRPSSF